MCIYSAFLWHAKYTCIEEEIMHYLHQNTLKHRNLLQCSMDGPSANHAFLCKLNARLECEQCLPLVDLGTCSLRPVHTTFGKGIEWLMYDVHSEPVKKRDILFLTITLANLNRCL